jgi:plastocyanin
MRRRAPSFQAFAIGVLIAAASLGTGCNSMSTSTTTPTSPSTGSGDGSLNNPITVFITNSTYSPNPVTVKVGQYVNFKNNDSILHSATFDNGTYESGDIAAFSAHDVAVQMTAAGTFTFHCRFHGEKGSIVATQ